ncbi:MAG: hypothetical protein Q8S41_13610 [Lutibacter sp.]|nr:hypothetical protein [Lutibacter sp.]
MAKKNKVINLFGNKNVIPNNTGISYSTLLDKFMAPFENDFPKDSYIEEIFQFALNAWNFGNMSFLMPKTEFEKTMALASADDGINYPLLKKMISHKAKNYKEFTNFIINFEITEKKGKDVLTVVTQSEENYLAEMMNSIDNQNENGDYDENYINRQAIVLKPLQPFVDWYINLYPNEEVPEFNESNIYLVNEEIVDLELWLKKKFDKFFMLELGDWHLNKKEWPQKRNYKMFKEWFHIEMSTMIYDLVKVPVSKSE